MRCGCLTFLWNVCVGVVRVRGRVRVRVRMVLVLLGLLTLVVLAGVAGFAWEQRASWQAAWAALQDTLWALAARWG